jgi:hypothetical protein
MPAGCPFKDAADDAKGSTMVRDNEEFSLRTPEFDEPQEFLWKSALVLFCLGIFALVVWSGSRESTQRCTETAQAAQETCVQNVNARTPHAPAKGVVIPPTVERTN